VVDIREDRPRAERQILSFALLVERARVAELDACVRALTAELPVALVSRFTGPVAPFHFVTLDLADGAPVIMEEVA